jgi:hypothetical protein
MSNVTPSDDTILSAHCISSAVQGTVDALRVFDHDERSGVHKSAGSGSIPRPKSFSRPSVSSNAVIILEVSIGHLKPQSRLRRMRAFAKYLLFADLSPSVTLWRPSPPIPAMAPSEAIDRSDLHGDDVTLRGEPLDQRDERRLADWLHPRSSVWLKP